MLVVWGKDLRTTKDPGRVAVCAHPVHGLPWLLSARRAALLADVGAWLMPANVQWIPSTQGSLEGEPSLPDLSGLSLTYPGQRSCKLVLL